MERFVTILLGLGLVIAGACADSTSGAGGSAGAGGNGGSGGDDCQSVELACQVLDESECARQEKCFVVQGALWQGSIEVGGAIA